jgi:hypothetical protein
MTNIIKVNFKTKEKIQSYKQVEYKCSLCYKAYIYDSRYDESMPRLLQAESGDMFCFSCVDRMYRIMKAGE